MKICAKGNQKIKSGQYGSQCGRNLIDENNIIEGKDNKGNPNNKEIAEPSMFRFIIIIVSIIAACIIIGTLIFMHSKNVSPKISKNDVEDFVNSLGKDNSKKSNIANTDESKEVNNNVNADQGGAYIIPNSDSEYLTKADVANLTIQEVNYAKNEIYARHGRRFKSKELMTYFSSKSWYQGLYEPEDFDANYSDYLLNDYEKKNAEFLREIEYSMDPNGYILDK